MSRLAAPFALLAMLGFCNSSYAQNASLTVVVEKRMGIPGPPPGQVELGASGTYTLAAGQTVSKVVVKLYRLDPATQNLLYVGTVDDTAPTNGGYRTTSLTTPKDDGKGGPAYEFKATAFLYVVGNPNPVASAATP